MAHQVVAIQHRMDRTDGGQVRAGELLTKLFTDLGRAPPGILALQTHDGGFDRRR